MVIEIDMEQMEKLLRTVIAEELELKLELKLKPIKEQLDMLANEKADDTLAMLKIINDKVDSIAKDVEFTYKKTSMNELEINRLKMQ